MRLWTFHPKYLDSKGLVALWREALLAQAILKRADEGIRTTSTAHTIPAIADADKRYCGILTNRACGRESSRVQIRH